MKGVTTGNEICFSKPCVTVMAISRQAPIVQEPCCRAQRAGLLGNGLLLLACCYNKASERTSWGANVQSPHKSECRLSSPTCAWLEMPSFPKVRQSLMQGNVEGEFYLDWLFFISVPDTSHTHTSPLIFTKAQ